MHNFSILIILQCRKQFSLDFIVFLGYLKRPHPSPHNVYPLSQSRPWDNYVTMLLCKNTPLQGDELCITAVLSPLLFQLSSLSELGDKTNFAEVGRTGLLVSQGKWEDGKGKIFRGKETNWTSNWLQKADQIKTGASFN